MNFKFFASLALSFFLIGQTIQSETKNTGTLSGKIIDNENQTGLDLVSIVLYKTNSTTPYLVKESDSNGKFSFTDILSGKYHLETKALGYTSHKRDVTITAGDETNLGQIILNTDTKMLKAVEVSGIRSNMKLEIDKKTYSVDRSIAAAGASASDILRNIPSVEVNPEGTISLRNSESVTVWINGKPSGLTADNRGQVLEQMPAENIDRIEVVTNPSAKFSSEGSAGIINLILKKNRKSGYYGSLSAGLSDPMGKNLGANINYSSTKLDAYANIGLRDEKRNGNGSSKRQTFNNQISPIDTSYTNSKTERSFGGNGLFLRAGFDYHLNDKHTLSLSGFSMNGNRNSNSATDNQYLNNNYLPTRQQMRNSEGDAAHRNFELTMDYLWEIAPDHSLQANLSHGKQSDTNETDYNQTNYNSNKDIVNKSYQLQNGPSNSNEWAFKVDYSHKFSENWKVEAGTNSEWENRYSENRIFNGIAQGSSWSTPTDPTTLDGFDYKEQKHAIYGTLTGKMNSKIGYQLGLRGEKTMVTFFSSDKTGAGTPNNKNYFDLFPTIFLNYTISEGSDIQLNYSKRINRPRGRSINPYVDLSDSTTIRSGNPALNPEYAHAFEMNYIKIWTNHTLSSSIYHRITKQVIQDIRYIENGIMYQKPSNVTNSTASGYELVAKDRLTKMLETTSTINLYYGTMDAFNYRGTTFNGTSGFSWNARLNGTLTFPKGFSGQISGFYTAPRLIAQGKSKGTYSLDMGLRKSLLDSKLQISINARNILNSFKFNDTTWGPGFHQESSNQFFGRNIRLNLTWNFGNLKPKKKMGKESNENSMEMGSEY